MLELKKGQKVIVHRMKNENILGDIQYDTSLEVMEELSMAAKYIA